MAPWTIGLWPGVPLLQRLSAIASEAGIEDTEAEVSEMADTTPLTETMLSQHEPRWIVPDHEHLPGRFGAITLGLIFLWIGVGVLANVGPAIGLVGAGLILLGAEVARKWMLGLPVEGMMIVVGGALLAGGILKLVQSQFDPLPASCLVSGAALILGAFRSRPAS
jgi:hypothetical protein